MDTQEILLTDTLFFLSSNNKQIVATVKSLFSPILCLNLPIVIHFFPPHILSSKVMKNWQVSIDLIKAFIVVTKLSSDTRQNPWFSI